MHRISLKVLYDNVDVVFNVTNILIVYSVRLKAVGGYKIIYKYQVLPFIDIYIDKLWLKVYC